MQIKRSLRILWILLCIGPTAVDKIDKQIKPKFIYWEFIYTNHNNKSCASDFRVTSFSGGFRVTITTTATKRENTANRHWKHKRAPIRSTKLQLFLRPDLKKYFGEAISKHKAKRFKKEYRKIAKTHNNRDTYQPGTNNSKNGRNIVFRVNYCELRL